MSNDHYVYIVKCCDKTLYTGYTTDVERRITEHNTGKGAQYTKGRTPVQLVHVECFDTQSAALSREHEIKSYTRNKKQTLIEESTDSEFS